MDVLLRGVGLHLADGGGSDPPLGHVDDPLHRQIVQGIVHGLHVGQQILDLFSSVEVYSPNDLVGNIGQQEFFLKQPGLGVSPVEHREIPVMILSGPAPFCRFPRPRTPPPQNRSETVGNSLYPPVPFSVHSRFSFRPLL